MKRHNSAPIKLLFLVLVGMILIGLNSSKAAAQTTIDLYLVNNTDSIIKYTISPKVSNCLDSPSPGAQYVLGANLRTKILLGRSQRGGCDGQQGKFAIETSIHAADDLQHFNFTNDGGLFLSNTPYGYDGILTPNDPVSGSYSWTTKKTNERIAGPLDERITMPRNYIAADLGSWDDGDNTIRTDLIFNNYPGSGLMGMYYEDCQRVSKLWHAQHVVRLPNKDGDAYFMAAQSNSATRPDPARSGGYITLMKVDSNWVDKETDLIMAGQPGIYIWQDLYNYANPIGHWNHPGKMEVIGGLLVVTMEDFDPPACDSGRGGSPEALVFYDIRDPEHPRYLATIESGSTVNSIGIHNARRLQYAVISVANSFHGRNIHCAYDTILPHSLVPSPFSPISIPSNWRACPQNAGRGAFSDQYGMNFNSYQIGTNPGAPLPNPLVERAFKFTSEPTVSLFSDDKIPFAELILESLNIGYEVAPTIDLPGSNRHWEDMTLYVTRNGMPILYGLNNDQKDYNGTNSDGVIHQIHHKDNLALRTPHPPRIVDNTNDHGPGSLRNAISYGGTITFAKALNNKSIYLTKGPLVVYLYDVNIDASSLPDGITINGSQGSSRIFQIEPGNKVTLNNLNIVDGTALSPWDAQYGEGTRYPAGRGGGILNRGDLTIINSKIRSNHADIFGGGIASDTGRLTIRNSTISGNSSNGGGGGIASKQGYVVIDNSTIANNSAVRVPESSRESGAGILNERYSTMVVRHSTIAGNTAAQRLYGVGILNNGKLTLERSIVADNSSPGIPGDLLGNYIAIGTNLVETHIGFIDSGPCCAITEDPKLEPLAINNGPTRTMGLQWDSPAIDAAGTSPFATDQRGFTRLVGAAADLGAVEQFIVNRSPGQGQMLVPIKGESLSWSNMSGAQFQAFLNSGSGYVSLGPPSGSPTKPLPGTLALSTEYMWRVDTNVNGQLFPGASFPFTTRGALIVTTLNDEDDPGLGQGSGDSLRELIATALPGETITFDASLSGKKIILNGSQIDINQALTIDASSLADGITIDAAGNSRVFSLTSAGTVIMKKLTITGGLANSGSNIIGAGIHNNGSALTLNRTVVTGNEASLAGGGLYSWNNGSITLIDSTVSDNNANAAAGIYFNGQNGGNLTIRRSTLSTNSANTKGGGLYVTFGTGLVENSTLADNVSASDQGGAVWTQSSSSVTLRHATVVGNIGMGIRSDGSGTLTLHNSIVANNLTQLDLPVDVDANFTAIGGNLIRVYGTSDLLGGPTPLADDPALESLGFFGGPTESQPPLAGSPVIGAGLARSTNLLTPAHDQRGGGYPRPTVHNAAIDLGSIESTLSSDASLVAFTTSAGQLKPAFLSGITSYTVYAPNSVTSARVRATAVGGAFGMKVRNDNAAFSTILDDGVASAAYPLAVGANTIEVEVTAANESTKVIYTITIVRDDTNTMLSALAVSPGSLRPVFASDVYAYDVNVQNGTTTATLTPTADDSQATITLSDDFGTFNQLVASGAASPPLPLNVGANRFNIKVTARDGKTTAVTTIVITRDAPPTSNANLSALTTSAGILDPIFSRGVTIYKLSLADDDNSITVTPTAVLGASAQIAIQANGGSFTPINSGAASSPISLNPGANTINVKVTAPDNKTVQTYIINITKYVDNFYWASEPGDEASNSPSISSDDRFVAFSSRATNLPGITDSNNLEDIFVYDRSDGTVERVSVDKDGNESNDDSTNPSISADGRFVAFQSEATNLVPNDTNGNSDRSLGEDIFVYDRDDGSIERISIPNNGGESNGASETPSISGDGRLVAFASAANNLVPGFCQTVPPADPVTCNVSVYVYDRLKSTNKLVGVSVPFDFDANRDSLNPVFSEDGLFVAFEFSVDLVADNTDDSYNYKEIYLYDRKWLTVQRIIEGNVGKDAHGTNSSAPTISADGRHIAYQSNLASIDFYDTNNNVDVFVYDRLTGLSERVSLDSAGAQGSGESTKPSISADGLFVAFESYVSTFVTPDANSDSDVFMKDLQTGELRMLSLDSSGDAGNAGSHAPSVSSDGRVVAFQSHATTLASGDGNSAPDIFVVATEAVATSAVADLSLLTANVGPLDPPFSAGVNAYTATVPNGVETLLLNPITGEAGATVGVGVNASSFSRLRANTTSSPLNLDVGENVVEVQVTAADGSTTKSYTMTVTREASSNADLSSLSLFGEASLALAPDFYSGKIAYSASAPKSTSSLTVTPTAAQANAAVRVNGKLVASGGTSDPIDLAVSNNTISVKVTAEDGSTVKNYVVTVNRAPNTAPVAYGQTLTAVPGLDKAIWLTGSDTDGDELTYKIINPPKRGSLIGNPPALVYDGSTNDSFTFTVNDGVKNSAVATITIVPNVPDNIFAYLPVIVGR